MIKIVFIILLVISNASGFIPVIFGIKHFKAFSTQLKALFVYLIAAVVTESSILIFTGLQLTGYITEIQLAFSIVEFLIIAYLYWIEFNKIALRVVIIASVILFFIALFIGWFITNNFSSVIDIADVVEASILIIFSVIYFFKVLIDLEIPKLTDHPFFWLNSAFLVYFGTAFFIFLFNNMAKEFDKSIIYFLSGIHHVVNVTYNILITIAICKVRKT